MSVDTAMQSVSAPRSLPTVAKARLAAEIVIAYARARRALRRYDLPTVIELLRDARRGGRHPVLADGERHGERLGVAVVRTLDPLPVDSRCLSRSLVLLSLLARRGVHASLVIAVRPSEELAFSAHAWVELAGRPLLEPGGAHHGRLVTL